MRLKSLHPTEDGIQRVIVEGLTLLGYTVYILSRRPRRCPRCKTWGQSGAGDGVTRGAPDLLVRSRMWPRGVSVGLEVKKPGPVRWSSAEQESAYVAGDTVLVQSLEEALRAVESMGNLLSRKE